MPPLKRVVLEKASTLPVPQESAHWKALDHDAKDLLLHNWQDFEKAVLEPLVEESTQNGCSEAHNRSLSRTSQFGSDLALWSCLLGYLEALSTHKQTRYQIFPIPWGALRRLVATEWKDRLNGICLPSEGSLESVPKSKKKQGPGLGSDKDSNHRLVVQAIANAVWKQAISKPNLKDELHANSVYIWLRGSIERKGLDCFGSAVTTLAACHTLQEDAKVPTDVTSYLTLSEDHAYERHYDKSTHELLGTCEVAVPGTTKAQQAKRGRGIEASFADKQRSGKSSPSALTPSTSWLYMADHPVVCKSLGETLVALVGNLNCVIDPPPSASKSSGSKGHRPCLASRQLYVFKRDLLWFLKDHGFMDKFPFGLLELGECEEHVGSARGDAWVELPPHFGLTEPVLVNEQLFLEAMQINQEHYHESQAYPYFYAGHYHKDAGNHGMAEDEYRLVYAMKYYAKAAQVASKYLYEGVDSLALNQHMTTLAKLILEDILTESTGNDVRPRTWNNSTNQIGVGTWLIAFFDSLLYWEEKSTAMGRGNQGRSFVEILSPGGHPFGISKLMGAFSSASRQLISEIVPSSNGGKNLQNNTTIPLFCTGTKSKRLQQTSLLWKALLKEKVKIGEMELTIPSGDDNNEGGGRRSKRRRIG